MTRIHPFAHALLCALLLGPAATAEPAETPSEEHRHEAAAAEPASGVFPEDGPPPDQAIVEVRGLVCSFCAYGVERELSRLDVVDTSQYGGDGVLVELEEHRVTIAFDPGAAFPLEEVQKRVRDAGYDPVRFQFWSEGSLRTVDVPAN